jgi:hypothetical protein
MVQSSITSSAPDDKASVRYCIAALELVQKTTSQPIVLIGESPGAGTVLIYTRFQLVVNNNGVTTVERADFYAQCQGGR